MFTYRILPKLLVVLLLGFTFTNCSSSSYTSRYKKPVPKEVNLPDKQNRFTSVESKSITETDTVNAAQDSVDVKNLAEFDEQPIEDYPIDNNEFVKNYKYIEKLSSALTDREKILFEIIKYLDTPYKFGGNDLNGIDCSGFTQSVFSTALGYTLPRSAREQFKIGDTIPREALEFGDLVFFNTRRRSNPGHVGIYLGDDLFAHSSSSLGVSISSMKSTYYDRRYIGAGRIVKFTE